jgi:HPt (histidine-containing phosphotransfer) domain-containing protein
MSEVLKLDEVFDRDEVMERVDGDIELLMEIVELFIKDYSKLMSNIKNAITQKDSRALARSAHTLKGSVGNFAADFVYNIALSLEVMGRNNDMTDAEEAYIKLEIEIERLIQAFDMLRKEVAL